MPRIVSLIASATEIVHALDLSPHQVGRSHECDFPPEVLKLPVCTRPRFAVNGSSAEIDASVKRQIQNAESLYEVFDDLLETLQPTHILTQTQCKVCAVSLDDVERSMSARFAAHPRIVALEPNDLAGIWADIGRVASACGVPERGQALIAALQSRIADLKKRSQFSGTRPRVACLDWQEPLMAAGNWVPELAALAHAEDVFGSPGSHSAWISWSDLLRADPDVIIVMPCGFDLARTRQEMYWLTGRSEWPQLRAVRAGRVFLVDGNRYMNRPGPGIVESLQILAEILHPDVFVPALESIAWQRWHS